MQPPHHESGDYDSAISKLPKIPYHGLLRPYQAESHQAVEEALVERKRKILVAMATGTGKTLTMVIQSYRLMKSGTARRILGPDHPNATTARNNLEWMRRSL